MYARTYLVHLAVVARPRDVDGQAVQPRGKGAAVRGRVRRCHRQPDQHAAHLSAGTNGAQAWEMWRCGAHESRGHHVTHAGCNIHHMKDEKEELSRIPSRHHREEISSELNGVCVVPAAGGKA